MLQSFLPIKDRLSSIFLFALLTVFSVSCGGGSSSSISSSSSASNLTSTNGSWPGKILINEGYVGLDVYDPKTKNVTKNVFVGDEADANAQANAILIKEENINPGIGYKSTILIYENLNKNKKISEFTLERRLYVPQLSSNRNYILAEIENDDAPNTVAVLTKEGKIIWEKQWKSADSNFVSSSYSWYKDDSFIFLSKEDKTIYEINPVKNTVNKLVALNKLPPEGYASEIKISPDGKHFAFNWFNQAMGGSTIWISSLDGKELTPLTSVSKEEQKRMSESGHIAFHHGITWSPDGKWIAASILNRTGLTTLPDNSIVGGEYAPEQRTGCDIPFIIPVNGPIQELDRYKMNKNITPMEKSGSIESPFSICQGGMQWMP